METKNLEHDFVESFGKELSIGLGVDARSAYLFALNLTEALTASNVDLKTVQKFLSQH